MKKLLLLFFASSFCMNAAAQGQANHWYFGTLAGLDFSGGAPVAVSGSLNSAEGTAAISSASGKLLFYTDGMSVWDSTHAVMANGSGLMGDVSTTQSAIVIPSLTTPSQYYLFTLAADGGPNGFRYSMVDMTLNGGLGDVTATKNVPVTDSVTEKLCAVKDASGTGYWIMVHKWGNDEFYAYHLTAAGLSAPVISAAGSVHSASPSTFQNTYGQMKFNMCGDKLALAMGYLDMVELFDFNNSTGVVSNPITLSMGYHVYGLEFSKSSQFLYVSSYDPSSSLNQFDISLGSQPLIAASKTSLSTVSQLYALQMGPDGKIYVSESFSSPFIGVIDSPNLPGTAANFIDNAILIDPLGNGVMGGLGFPSFLQDYLKINVTCSVGINEAAGEEDALIYPNPGTDEFTILFKGEKPSEISVCDHTGRLIEAQTLTADVYSFGKSYAPGMYFVSCKDKDAIKIYKVIKN